MLARAGEEVVEASEAAVDASKVVAKPKYCDQKN
jgi:hypothetical protein